MTIKSENQIYKDLVQLVRDALSYYSITDWQVLQLKQPVKLTEIKPAIYITLTTRTRRGWQYRNYPFEDNVLKHKESFWQEVNVQISALKRRSTNDTTETINSIDILEYIKTYILNIDAIKDLRKSGYTIYQPSEIQNPDFFDDSDNFEFMPFFSVTLIINQSLICPQASIDGYTYKIERV